MGRLLTESILFRNRMLLEDKVAIVTGGGKGIGRAIALELAEAGCSLGLASRSEKDLMRTCQEIGATGRRAVPIRMDITQYKDIEKMVDKIIETFGTIDILVNNAGITGPTSPLHEIELVDWEKTLRVNVTGTFLCCKAVLPTMIHNKRGKIINISSASGKRPIPNRTVYGAAKMGIIGLTRSLAAETGKFNINVNAVSPGPVSGFRIQEVLKRAGDVEGLTKNELETRLLSASPLGRMVSERDVAKMVAFLASENAVNITGQDFGVNAGSLMT